MKAFAARRERVAEEAEELFAHEGFLHFSTTQIAKRLRCSKTTIYSMAPSREKFFELIARRIMTRLNQKWIDAAKRAPNCVATVAAFLETSIESVGAYGDRFAADLHSFPGGLRAIKQTEAQRLALLERTIAEGARTRLFRNVDPKLVAAALMGAVDRVIQPKCLSRLSLSYSQALRELLRVFNYGLVQGKSAARLSALAPVLRKSSSGQRQARNPRKRPSSRTTVKIREF